MRALLCAVACLVLAFGLAGCKHSDVLTEHIEDPDLGALDESAEPIYKNVPGAPFDETRVSFRVDASERIDDQTREIPEYNGEVDAFDKTKQRKHEEQTPHEQNATEGDEQSEAEGASTIAGTGTGTGAASGAGSGAGTGQNDEKKQESGEGEGNGPANAGAGGTGQVYDGSGTDVELPEDVGSIAAVGQYATIVQMLAGRGGLVAADDAWIADVGARGLFPDEGVDAVKPVWTADGEGGYALDLEALIAAEPDVVLVDNKDVALSEDEQARLSAAGVNVVTVPTLGNADTPDADVKAAVAVAGELLRTAQTQYDTSTMVTIYNEQHDEAVANCLSANGGYTFKMTYGSTYQGIYQGTSAMGEETTSLSGNRYTTAFVDSWTFAVSPSTTALRRYGDFSLYLDGEPMDASDGAGLSAAGRSANFMLIDYYLQVSGVVNNAYEGAKPSMAGDGELGSPYLIAAGDTRELTSGGIAVSARTIPSALWYSPTSISTDTAWTLVGDPVYPCVLVRSADIAQRIATSAAKVNGLYNVGQPYQVRVVPTGVAGSWADGTVESFLMAPWAYCVFQGAGDLSVCSGYVENYYATFYRTEAGAGAVADYESVYDAACPRE